MRLWIVAAVAAVMMAGCQVTANAAVVIMSDNFDQNAAGTAPPAGWSLAGSIAGTSAQVVDGAPAGNRWVDFHDDNPSGNTKNNTLYRTFAAVTSGTCIAQFDIKLLQTTAAFGARLYNGSTPTTVSNCATGVLFEGIIPYSTGGGQGKVSYQAITTGSNAYVLTNPLVTYTANAWYTLKVVASVDTKKYQVFFGPQGGTLNEITPPGGVDFIKTTATPPAQADRIAGMSFFSSTKDGDASGDLIIDNVLVQGDIAATDLGAIAEAKAAPIGTFIRLTDKIVTAGSDQLAGPFFYVQDDTGGMRVRSGAVVHQGDRVTVVGPTARCGDNGSTTRRNGEKEICGLDVTVTTGPFPLPAPVGMTNHCVGGGPFGPIDPDGYVAQPGVYASGESPNQAPEVGLSSVGRYGRFWGKVVYTNDTSGYMYVEDGSQVLDGMASPPLPESQRGVRVLVKNSGRLACHLGDYALITGIAGAASASELGSSGNINNVRVIRAVEETYTDLDSSGGWDPGEPYVDSNGNGLYDGITYLSSPALETTDLRFDVVTFCCPCSLDDHMCQAQFDALNWASARGHYIAMGSDAHRSEVEANGNKLAAYYNSLNDNWTTVTGEQRADEIEARFAGDFPSGVPKWIIVNEISPGTWPSNATYRAWVIAVVKRLATRYCHNVILYSPFPTPGANGPDWQQVAQYAYIGIECYLSGEDIRSNGFSVSWCQSQYSYSRSRYTALGVPADKLFIGEHFGQTTSGASWGRSGVSYAEWDSALNARHTAVHNLAFPGFISYAWAKNAMGVSDAELIHFEETYRAKPLP